jgi:hypothetical protein
MIRGVLAQKEDLLANRAIREARPIFEAPVAREHETVRSVSDAVPCIGCCVAGPQQAQEAWRNHVFDDGPDEILHARPRKKLGSMFAGVRPMDVRSTRPGGGSVSL